MDLRARPSKSLSFDEHVRRAHAQRSMAIGYAIGDALAALWRVVSSFSFSPSASASASRKRARMH
jgi:hypothetical protein